MSRNKKWQLQLDVLNTANMDDWYEIVVANLPEMYWMQRLIPHDDCQMKCSRLHSVQRISDCCVEGTKAEMLDIARGIRTKTTVEHKRCAVSFEYDKAYFWSPRNSEYQGEVDYEVALKLAEKLEKL